MEWSSIGSKPVGGTQLFLPHCCNFFYLPCLQKWQMRSVLNSVAYMLTIVVCFLAYIRVMVLASDC